MPKRYKGESWNDLLIRQRQERREYIKHLSSFTHSLMEAARMADANYGNFRNAAIKLDVIKYFNLHNMVKRRRQLAEMGMGILEAAKAEKVSYQTMRKFSKRHGIKWKKKTTWKNERKENAN